MPPLVSDLQRRIYSAMLTYVSDPHGTVDPPLHDVITTGAIRASALRHEAVTAWDRLVGEGDMWVSSQGRVVMRGREPRPVPAE